MKSAPGLRGLYPRPERRDFTPLSVKSESDSTVSLKKALVGRNFIRRRRSESIHEKARLSAVMHTRSGPRNRRARMRAIVSNPTGEEHLLGRDAIGLALLATADSI